VLVGPFLCQRFPEESDALVRVERFPVQVRLTPRARRQLDRLPAKQSDLVRDELEKLAAEDERLDVKKLAGEADSYRLRIGDYRVIFIREADQVAVVTRIGHRRDVYRRQ